MSPSARWHVNITDEADRDLKRLRKRDRKAWREAVAILRLLKDDPYIGEACDPPLRGVWRTHFGSDKHRIAWLVQEDVGRVDILAAGPKTPTYYDRVHQRLTQVLRDLARRFGDVLP